MTNNMAPNLFSLTNLLLATSFFFAISNAAPISMPFVIESREHITPLQSRDMWNEIATFKARDATIDPHRIDTTVLPAGRTSRILPRSHPENPPPHLNSRQVDFSAPKPSPLAHRQIFPRFSVFQDMKIGSVVRETGSVRQSLIPRMSAMGELEKSKDIWMKASFDPAEPVQKRDMENMPIGATNVLYGKLWRRGLKAEA